MMGMMTLARVLPAEKYERMLALIKTGQHEPGQKLPDQQSQHKHSG